MRQRREDVERLLGLLDLLLLRKRLERAHVVEAIGQLDQDHPDVVGHRDHHLPVVLRLLLVAALEGDAGELGDAVDQLGDLLAEALLARRSSEALVSSTVSCSRAAQIVWVSSRMPAQILATPTGCVMNSSPDLRRWSACRSHEKLNASATWFRSTGCERVVGMLGDDREQVAQQLPLVLEQRAGQLLCRGRGRQLLAQPDADVRLGQAPGRRRPASVPGAAGAGTCATTASPFGASSGEAATPPCGFPSRLSASAGI